MKVNYDKIDYKEVNGEIVYDFPGAKNVLSALWAVTFGGLFSGPE